MKFIFIFLFAIITSAASVGCVAQTVGSTRTGGIGESVAILADVSGWRVVLTTSPSSSACIAIKPSSGGAWPHITYGHANLYSGLGAYISGDRLLSGLRFGFYGRKAFRKTEVALVDERVVTTFPIDEVYSWEGKQVSFEVTTGNYRNLYHEAVRESGYLDFTGVIQAIEMVKTCVQGMKKNANI